MDWHAVSIKAVLDVIIIIIFSRSAIILLVIETALIWIFIKFINYFGGIVCKLHRVYMSVKFGMI